jgi:hypothetical protein
VALANVKTGYTLLCKHALKLVFVPLSAIMLVRACMFFFVPLINCLQYRARARPALRKLLLRVSTRHDRGAAVLLDG